MKSLLNALIVAALAVTWPVSADAASLRRHVVVEDGLVRLGDVFDNAGPRADVAVAQAPAPGRRNSFDVNWLAQLARAYQVDWRPQSRFDRVVIERAGRIVDRAEIMSKLEEALLAEGMRRGGEIELANARLDVAVALDAPADVDVYNLSYDSRSGRFAGVVLVGGHHGSAQRIGVSGRTYNTAAVPVLRRSLQPGDIIRKDDIEWTRIREDKIGRDVVTDPQRLVGTTPRHRLRGGEPVGENDTRAPVVVERNSTVMIMLQTGNLTLTAQGRATEDGAKGDTIRVVNLQSKKTIEVVVTGPDLVTVQLGLHRAAN